MIILANENMQNKQSGYSSLSEADNKFFQTFNLLKVPVILLTRSHTLLAMNQAAITEFGLPKAKDAPYCWSMLWGANEPCQNCPMQLLDELHEEGTALVRCNDQNRSERVVSVFPLYDNDGRELGIIHLAIQMTSSITGENFHCCFSQHYLNLTDDLFITLGLDAITILANNRASAVLGLDTKDIIGCNWFETFVVEEDRDSARGAFLDLLDGSKESTFQTTSRILLSDGASKPIRWKYSLGYDDHGSVAGILLIGTDLAPEDATTKALHFEEAMNKSLMYTSTIGAGLALKGVIQEVNDQTCRMLGISHVEVIGKRFVDFIPTVEEAKKFESELSRQLKYKDNATVETRWRRSNSEIINILFGVSPIVGWQDGDGLTFSALDITASKLRETELIASEERFRVLFEMAPDPYIMQTDDGILLDINKAGEILFNCQKEEVIGQVVNQLSGMDVQPSALGSNEMVVRQSDGTKRDIQLTTYPVKIDDKGVVLVLGRDITEAKAQLLREQKNARELQFLADKALEMASFAGGEDIARFIVDNMRHVIAPDSAVIVFERDAPKEVLKIMASYGLREQCNNKNCNLDNFEWELSAKLSGLLESSKLKKFNGNLHELFNITPGDPNVCKNLLGDIKYPIIHVIGFMPRNILRGGIIIFTQGEQNTIKRHLIDALAGQAVVALERQSSQEELKQAEEQLRQSQKMEAIGTLAGGVAHDFNNMLGAILGYGEVTLDKMPEDSALRKDVEQIISAANRASKLTQQLLAFSRKQILQPKVIDVNQSVIDVEKMLKRLIGENIELQVKLSGDTCNIVADPSQIEQVLLNLAVNARDALSEHGRILIETSTIMLDEEYARLHPDVSAGEHIRLSVSDNGEGIPENLRSKIFEPFFSTKKMGKGTGLGLAMVHGIIKQSGGEITVYSELTKGTTFNIYLPKVDIPVEKSPEDAPMKKAKGGSETILVVEDEKILRRLVIRMLGFWGYNILEACNGEEACKLCEETDEDISLIMTDIIMPKMSGLELANNVKKYHPDIKVLFMSGYSNGAATENGGIEPDAHFIAKPFSSKVLARKVREVLESNNY